MYDNDDTPDAPTRVEPMRVHLAGADIPMFDVPDPILRRYGISLYSRTLTTDDKVQPLLPLNARRCKAWILPLANDITIGTDKSELQAGGNGVATIPGSGAHGTTVTSTGVVTGPAAGATITSIPASSLPAGWYDLYTVAHYGGTTAVAAERNNMQIQTPTTAIYVINIPGQAASNGYMIPTSPPIRTFLDGLTALSITAIGAGTGTAVYSASIIAVPQKPVSTAPFPLDTTDPIWATAAVFPTIISIAAIIQER